MAAVKDAIKWRRLRRSDLSLPVIWQQKRDFTWYDFAGFQLRKIREPRPTWLLSSSSFCTYELRGISFFPEYKISFPLSLHSCPSQPCRLTSSLCVIVSRARKKNNSARSRWKSNVIEYLTVLNLDFAILLEETERTRPRCLENKTVRKDDVMSDNRSLQRKSPTRFFTTVSIILFGQPTVLIVTGRESWAVQVYEMIYTLTPTLDTYNVFMHALYS